MKKKIRPLSPHLLVYKSQITSVFSILHRMSAGLLFVFLIVVFTMFYVVSLCSSLFVTYFVSFYVFDILKLCFYCLLYFMIFSFVFHAINGLRHLCWDFSLGLEIKDVYLTGGFVFVVSFLIVCFLVVV